MTDYDELAPEVLVALGVAQLGEAQDAYRAALHGGEIVLTDPDAGRKALHGEAAKAHATWLLKSAHAHFRAALALDMVANSGEMDYDEEDYDDAPDEASDDPPAN